MRIVWDEANHFQAELTSGDLWSDDKNALQVAGFRTSGPPDWIWSTSKSANLNKLKKLSPKSGIILTELALSKYQAQEKHAAEKAALKKQYKKLRTEADRDLKQPKYKTAVDPDLGFTYLVVEPKPSNFVWTPPKRNLPDGFCIVCGVGLYAPDYPDICLWCSKTFAVGDASKLVEAS